MHYIIIIITIIQVGIKIIMNFEYYTNNFLIIMINKELIINTIMT